MFGKSRILILPVFIQVRAVKFSELDMAGSYSYTDYFMWQFEETMERIKGKNGRDVSTAKASLLPRKNFDQYAFRYALRVTVRCWHPGIFQVYKSPFQMFSECSHLWGQSVNNHLQPLAVCLFSNFSLALPVITKKSKYAYKAMLVLVDEYGRGPVLISTISDRANIPKKFLEVILFELRHAGYVESKKGKGGGYYLKVPPSQISLAKVFRTIEGPIAPVACVSLNFYEKCHDCDSEITCRFRKLMEKLRDANLGVLEANSFSDLARINEPE